MRILCVDIGGTRIKAAILPSAIRGAELSQQTVITMRTLGWANQSLPQLFQTGSTSSLMNPRFKLNDFDAVSLAVSSLITKDGRIDRLDLLKNGIPEHLENEIEKIVSCKVKIVNDGEAWMRGAIKYSELTGGIIEFPSLLIALGTGVGLGLALTDSNISSVEVNVLRNHFPCLEEAAGRKITESYMVHHNIGDHFFAWVARERKHWDYEKIQEEYSNRISGFISDLLKLIPQGPAEFSNLFIGGGNAEYVSIGQLKKRLPNFQSRITAFTADNCCDLHTWDLIPLLGLGVAHSG